MEMMEPSTNHRESAKAAVEQDTLLEFAMENKQEDLQYFKAHFSNTPGKVINFLSLTAIPLSLLHHAIFVITLLLILAVGL